MRVDAMFRSLSKVALLAAGTVAVAAVSSPPAAHAGGPYQYYAVTPCRVADTRAANGATNCPATGNCTPALVGNGTARSFQIQGLCGVPVGAAAATINVTIATPQMTVQYGFLTLWPSGATQPRVSTINFSTSDQALANGAIVPLSTNTQDLAVYFGGAGTVQLIVDVTGYFM
jgi:hypothetical protein